MISTRLLIGTDAGVTDVCVVDSVPLAVSSNWSSAVVVVGAGSVITVHNSSSAGALGVSTSGAVSVDLSVKEPSHRRLHMSIEATESEFDEIESIEQRMVSMCKAGYAVDAGRNIQVISDKLDVLAYESPESFMKRSRMLLQLQRVWCWVDRVESMSILDPALSLQNCGVLQLIEAHGTSDVDSVANKGQLLDNMPCRVYESKNRKAARSVCGWATLKLTMDASVSPTASAEEDPHEATYLDLEDLVEEYVKYGEYLIIV